MSAIITTLNIPLLSPFKGGIPFKNIRDRGKITSISVTHFPSFEFTNYLYKYLTKNELYPERDDFYYSKIPPKI